jgi:DNA replication protein DnaC
MSTETQTGPCTTCGATVEREIPADKRFAAVIEGVPFLCTRCAETQEAAWQAAATADAVRAEREQQQRRLDRADLPALLSAIDLDTLDPDGCEDAIASARYWAMMGGGLLLTGPYGVGKTTIAAGALRLRLEKAHGRWLSAPLMMARLGSGLDSRERHQVLATLTGSSALVLDDLDKTRPTEYGAEQIFLAVDGSVTSGRPLLVTTNLGLGQLAAKWPAPFGEAIASRLAGYCKVVAVEGVDRRLSGLRSTGEAA